MTAIDPMFAATPLEKRNQTIQSLIRTLLLAVALLLVVPALAILGVLVWEGAPGLSWSFLVDPPRDNGAAGGIGLPLLGTLWLIFNYLRTNYTPLEVAPSSAD